MKTVVSIVAFITSVVSISLSAYIYNDQSKWRVDMGSEKPADVVPKIKSWVFQGANLDASSAFQSAHAKEILNTLEVADTSISGDHGIVFVRYSVGTSIYREAWWVGKVQEKWYWIPHLSEYSGSKPDDAQWFKETLNRKEKWEEESANLPF